MEGFEGYESIVSDMWVGDLDDVESIIYSEIWFKGKTPNTADCDDTTPREIRESIIPSIIAKASRSHNPGWPRKEYEFSDGFEDSSDGYAFDRDGTTKDLNFSDQYPVQRSHRDFMLAEAWSKGPPSTCKVTE